MKRLGEAKQRTESLDELKNSDDKLLDSVKELEEVIDDFKYEFKHRYEECESWMKACVEGKEFEEPEEEAEFQKDCVVEHIDNIQNKLNLLRKTFDSFFDNYAKLLKETTNYNKQHGIKREEQQLSKEEEEKMEKEIEHLFKSMGI